jgi:pimeloyl-ACP methyl ester carboxylesterase
VERLRDRFRILRYDMRGFGETTSPPGPFSPASDLEALVSAAGVERCALVGASFGGYIAMEFAATHPDAVERLVVLDPPYEVEWSERTLAFFEAEDAALEAGRIDDAVELNVEFWAAGATSNVKALIGSMQERAFRLQLATQTEPVEIDPPVHERLADLAMPVTVVYGEHDVEDFVAIAKMLARELPSATLHEVPGAAHLPALEAPDTVAELIVSRL